MAKKLKYWIHQKEKGIQKYYNFNSMGELTEWLNKNKVTQANFVIVERTGKNEWTEVLWLTNVEN